MYSGNNRRVYIGNLPEDVTEAEIDEIFHKFGSIRDIDIKYGRTTNGTAYAFLEFEDARDAEDSVDSRDGYKFGGTRLRVEFTGERRPKRGGGGKSSGPPRRSEYRVYVTHLPPSASWQDLKDHMREAGPVGYANIERGRGVVEYECREDMEWALKELDGSEFRNIFSRCSIKVRPGYSASRSRSRSPSRSPSRGRRRRRSQSRSGSRSRQGRSRSKSRESKSNRSRAGEGQSKSRGRSNDQERSRSRGRESLGGRSSNEACRSSNEACRSQSPSWKSISGSREKRAKSEIRVEDSDVEDSRGYNKMAEANGKTESPERDDRRRRSSDGRRKTSYPGSSKSSDRNQARRSSNERASDDD